MANQQADFDAAFSNPSYGAKQGGDEFDSVFSNPNWAPPKKPEGGLIASLKQTGGQLVKSAGQAAADFIPGVSQDNALKSYGQEVVDANPTAVRSLSDVAASPWTATKEAVGNAVGSMGAMVGAQVLGKGIEAAAPLAGPARPLVSLLGKGIQLAGPTVTAALPSYGGIREQQIQDDPTRADSPEAKARAALGAGAVGLIETSFGPERWALAATNKAGREKVIESLAGKSLVGSIGKGMAKGAAVEGAEEVAQNPIEQLAGYQDPTTAANLQDTAFSGVMGALGGGVLGGAGGGISYAARPEQPQVDPSAGPLSRAAATAQETGAAGLAQTATGEDMAQGDAAATDPMTARLAGVASFAEDKNFLRALRGDSRYGPESVTELLGAYATARNPQIDPTLRENALNSIEQFTSAFVGPNAFGGQQDFTMPPNEPETFVREPREPTGMVPFNQGTSLAQSGQPSPFDPNTMEGQAREVGTLPRQMLTGPEDAAQQYRRDLLESVLSDPDTRNPLPRYESLLKKNGFEQRRATPEERQLIEDRTRPAEPERAALPPFAAVEQSRRAAFPMSQEGAHRRAAEQTQATGQPFEAVPHPSVPGRFAVQPVTAANTSPERVTETPKIEQVALADQNPIKNESPAVAGVQADAGEIGAEQSRIEPTNSLSRTASWVIREKGTGKVVMETFDRNKVDALNTNKYEAVPIQEHLASLNRQPTNALLNSDEIGAQGTDNGAPPAQALPPTQERGTAQQAETVAEQVRDATPRESAALDRAAPVLDLNKRPTGWKQVDYPNGDGVLLISADGKKAINFPSRNAKSGTEALRAQAKAQAFAIDNPHSADTPQGELVVKPIFEKQAQQAEVTNAAQPQPLEPQAGQASRPQGAQEGGVQEPGQGVGRTLEVRPSKLAAVAAHRALRKAYPEAQLEVTKQGDGWAVVDRTDDPFTDSPANAVEGAMGRLAQLQGMADAAGWSERGGKLLRDDGAEGEVTGRTKWVPTEAWFAGKPAGVTEQHMRSAVEKIASGRGILTKPERDGLAYMQDTLRDLESQDRTRQNEASARAAELEALANEAAAELTEAEVEAIREQLAVQMESATQDDYLLALKEAFHEKAIQSRTRRETGQADARGARQGVPEGRGESGREAPAFSLESQTPQELAARDAARQATAEREQREQQERERKAQADAERGAFTLTGSDRAADVQAAQGQGGLFDGQSAPANSPEPRAAQGQQADTEADAAAEQGTHPSIARRPSLDGAPAWAKVLMLDGWGNWYWGSHGADSFRLSASGNLVSRSDGPGAGAQRSELAKEANRNWPRMPVDVARAEWVNLQPEAAQADTATAEQSSGVAAEGVERTQFSRAPAPKSLNDVKAAWTEDGIKFAISERDNVITVSRIVVPEGSRNAGIGTRAMQVLVDYADRNGKHIALTPSADFGGNKKRLTEFYKRFGFVENKGKNRAFSVSEGMIRESKNGDPLFSFAGESARSADMQGTTPEAIWSAVESLVGPLRRRRIVVVQSADVLVEQGILQSRDANGAQAFVKDGKAYFIASNIQPGNERAVFLHEVGAHLGMEKILSPLTRKFLLNNIRAWAKESGTLESRIAKAALRRVEAAGGQDADAESLAYFVEEAVKAGIDPKAESGPFGKWFRALWNGIKSALQKLELMSPDRLTAQDIVDLAHGAANVAMGEDATGGDIQFSRAASAIAPDTEAVSGKARDFLADALKRPGTFGLFARSLNTQFHKATQNPQFKAVWTRAHAMFMDSSRAMSRPAELAPELLPKFDLSNMGKAAKAVFGRGQTDRADIKAVADVLSAGTLAGGAGPMEGVVWSDRQLTEDGVRVGDKFVKLTAKQLALYKEARAAIDASLDESAAAEAWKLLRRHTTDADLRNWLAQNPQAAPDVVADTLATVIERETAKLEDLNLAAKEAPSKEADKAATKQAKVVADLKDTEQRTAAIFDKAKTLKDAGYMPLMRFGQFRIAVTTQGEKGEKIAYVSRYESAFEANRARRQLMQDFPASEGFTVGAVEVTDQDAWKQFKGVSPETVMLFAKESGIDADEVMQAWYKEAVASRSSLRRMVHRKGYQGFSDDLPRVLASFITSNGKAAGYAYHLADMQQMMQDEDMPGDVHREARELLETITQPTEKGANVRGLMASWYLLGSVASAITNATQTATMSLPFLSQFGKNGFAPGEAMGHLARAYSQAFGKIKDKALADAVKRAEEAGIVDSNEVFHLYAEAMKPMIAKLGNGGLAYRARAFMTLWGAPFAIVEKLNRKSTFIAAYNMAKAQGKTDAQAYELGERAVVETQGVYAVHNRPNWARGAVGGAVLTFRQFSIAYLELASRMWQSGPEGKKAAGLMLGILFMTAGLGGMPGEDDLLDLIDTFSQTFFGKATISKMELRNWLQDTLGKEMGAFVNSGVSAFLPLDVSGRMGMGNLIPGTAVFKPSEPDPKREMLEVLGVPGSFAMSAIDGAKMLMQGDATAAVRAFAPKAVQDVVKGAEMLRTGEARDMRGRKIVDVGMGDAFIQAIGFNPSVKAEAGRKAVEVNEMIGYNKRMESEIVGRLARGVADRDQDAIAEAQQQLTDWNRTNPDAPIIINSQQVRHRIMQLQMERSGRIVKMAPPELRRRVSEALDE